MRLRREERLDPAVVSELEAIDRAVRGEGADSELDRLAFALRAERPVPEREFAAELDALVRTGFSAVTTEAPSARRPWVRRYRVALAFGAAATIFIAVTAVLSSGLLTSTSTEPTAGEGEVQSLSRDSAQGAAGATAAAPSAPPGQALAPRARRREVERQASLKLAAPRDDIESVADDVIAITDRYRGFVLSSTVSGGERDAAASLDLRIPAGRLQPALADLSELAHVRSRTQSSQDVTGAVSSLRERLGAALAERRFLLNRLERATTDSEAASLRARVRIANRRIARIRNAFRAQRNRVDFAAVSVAIEADESTGGDGSWSPGEALEDAGGILETSAAIAVVTLALLVPVALLVLLAWGGARGTRRHLRERALDVGSQIEKRAPR